MKLLLTLINFFFFFSKIKFGKSSMSFLNLHKLWNTKDIINNTRNNKALHISPANYNRFPELYLIINAIRPNQKQYI